MRTAVYFARLATTILFCKDRVFFLKKQIFGPKIFHFFRFPTRFFIFWPKSFNIFYSFSSENFLFLLK